MALRPLPDRRPPLPRGQRRAPLPSRWRPSWTAAASRCPRSGSLLRAEGIAISRTRLHQLCSGSGAPPTAEQLERLASVLGVSPGYFAEYRLWRVRALLDPAVVGFDRAMANFDRLRGPPGPADRVGGPTRIPASRYPAAVSVSRRSAHERDRADRRGGR